MTRLTLENTAIVVDSTCDPPPGYYDRPGLAMVPLKVNFGDETYRDGVDLSPPEFFAKLASSPVLPTTSQPTVGEFTAVYAALSREYEHIFAFHLSSTMSGTYQASLTAAQPYAGVEVYDTRTVSATITLLVDRLRARLADGVSLDEAHAYIEHFLQRESHALPGPHPRVPAARRAHRQGAVDGRRRVRHQADHHGRRRRARGLRQGARRAPRPRGHDRLAARAHGARRRRAS